jgi:hypothetical protein
MVSCDKCGSIQIVRANPAPADRFVKLFTSRRPFVCRRCGWRGRKEWTDEQLLSLQHYGIGGAAPDPTLVSLDEPKRRRRGGQGSKSPKSATSHSRSQIVKITDFDLATIDLATDASSFPPPTPDSMREFERSRSRSSGKKRRLRRSGRREIIATVALTALAMFVFLIAGLTGSCADRL